MESLKKKFQRYLYNHVEEIIIFLVMLAEIFMTVVAYYVVGQFIAILIGVVIIIATVIALFTLLF